MVVDRYEFAEVERDVHAFWKDKDIVAQARKKGDKSFYFLDGPPYTSGQIHIGTAWNKSMKDVVLRYRRMQGYAVWDRAGYDMHGLPNEHGTMEDLGLADKDAIEAYGVDRFITACAERAQKNMERMNEEFLQLGVWMDFADAYQTMSPSWTEAVWWLVKKADSDGRLYEGLRPMAWDPVHESACAKHELYYESVEDASIYVKFMLLEEKDTYFVVWTTTPWTIPFNLMIMANPDIDYAYVSVGSETWIVAQDLVDDVLSSAEKEGVVTKTVKGAELVGMAYRHFLDEFPYEDLKKEHARVHTVVPSKEYVTTDYGSGLVHAAPGCGPEDYEVGVAFDVPSYNVLDSKGRFPAGHGAFSGLTARSDDEAITELIRARGALVATAQYVHDYPFAERSKSPVVYKATKQWFFRVHDLKEAMIAGNQDVHWNPGAGFNAFTSWLENLRDNSISKQRYWGTPLPIWKNVDDPDDYFVVGSREELVSLAKSVPDDLHKPFIDDVVIVRDGKTYRRVPDVIDVWVDAGIAAYACLGFPESEEMFSKYFPADFIIEGNDQVRGWFNLLMVTSMLGFGQTPFKNVYMHGMVNDAQGRKMSKSEGNYIVPEEVLSKYGTDAVRLYFVGGARAGNDFNYNHDDCENKHRKLHVMYNIHKYLLDVESRCSGTPGPLLVEDEYIIAVAHAAARDVHSLMERYEIDKVPVVVEELFDEISRTYIQYVRPRVSQDDVADRMRVAHTLRTVYDIALRLLAPITPFITEHIYQRLRGADDPESIHLTSFPAVDERLINESLIEEIRRANAVTSTILAARDKAQLGVRWPLRSASTTAKPFRPEVERLVLEQTNVRALEYVERVAVDFVVEPDFQALGRDFGTDTARIGTWIKEHGAAASKMFSRDRTVVVDGHDVLEHHLSVTPVARDGMSYAGDGVVEVVLDTSLDDELLRDGFYRELVRRVQRLRKQADLEKDDRVLLHVDESLSDVLEGRIDEFSALVGASRVELSLAECPHMDESVVRGRSLRIGFFLDD